MTPPTRESGAGVRIVLASASPRRAELLRRIGQEPVVIPADVDESPLADEDAVAHVLRLAAAKADAVAGRVRPDDLIVAADTVVVLDGSILGKPADDEDAARMLRTLSGRVHEVVTGVRLQLGARAESRAVSTRVTFRAITEDEITAYVASGEPSDKAGAYAVQGGAGAFTTGIDGSDTNVIGLPLADVVGLAAELGVRLLPAPRRP